jgi:hypothetical protein
VSRADFRVDDHGSIVLITPITDAAEAWVDENLPDSAMTFGSAVVIEPRYVGPILEGISADGLTVAWSTLQ